MRINKLLSIEADSSRPLKNAPFCPIFRLRQGYGVTRLRQAQTGDPPVGWGVQVKRGQILILEILDVFLWLKFSPSLTLNKIERFSKVSALRPRVQGEIIFP